MNKSFTMLLISAGIVAFSSLSALAAPKPHTEEVVGDQCRPGIRTIFQRFKPGTDAREDAIARFLKLNPGCAPVVSDMAINDPNGTGAGGTNANGDDDGPGGRNRGGNFILIPVNSGGGGGGSVSR